MSFNPHLEPYIGQFNQISVSSFRKNPYHWQAIVGSTILHAVQSNNSINQLCVRPTGGGKSLLFTVLARCFKGVTLCITPLLSLGSDQVRKLLANTRQSDTSITSFHLDEMSVDDILRLETGLMTLCPTKTVVLFSSPQRLIGPASGLLKFLLSNAIFKFVVVDEIHLVSSFAQTFRSEFASLKTHLFSKLPTGIPKLFLTATCTKSILESLKNIFGTSFNSIHWPSPNEMIHRSVRFELEYTNKAFHFVSKSIKAYLTPHQTLPNKVIIYSNRRSKIMEFSENLESFFDLDDYLCNVDILTLVGTLTILEKSQYIRYFVSPSTDNTNSDINFKVLCATSGVGNAGIDAPDIRAVYRIEFPPSILDMCQELGRAGRNPQATSLDYVYKVYISIESFLHIFRRIYDPENKTVPQQYKQQQMNDLLEVANILVSSKQCFSILFECRLGNPDYQQHNLERCQNCPSCLGVKLFPKLNKQGLTSMLFNLFIDGDNLVPFPRDMNNVIKSIRKYKNAPQLMFGRREGAKDVKPIDVKKALFILIAKRVMKLSLVTEVGDSTKHNITFGLARSETLGSTLLAFQDDSYWHDIEMDST